MSDLRNVIWKYYKRRLRLNAALETLKFNMHRAPKKGKVKKWGPLRNPCNRVSFILENKRMKSDLEAAHLSSEAEKKEVNILNLSLKQKDAEIERLKELTR